MLATDDPCVADELSLPTVTWFRTPDTPPAGKFDVSVEFAKRITENFGLSVAQAWTQVGASLGPAVTGFQNLETTFQYQLLKEAEHELAIRLGLVVEWGGTGATNSGLASSFGVLTPTLWLGKGLGELPDQLGFIRPFAVTAPIGYQVPTSSFDLVSGTLIPQQLVYGGTLQYSMPYLKTNVIDLDLPDLLNHLIPIVEAQFATPVANNTGNSFVTTGTINPGVIWVGN